MSDGYGGTGWGADAPRDRSPFAPPGQEPAVEPPPVGGWMPPAAPPPAPTYGLPSGYPAPALAPVPAPPTYLPPEPAPPFPVPSAPRPVRRDHRIVGAVVAAMVFAGFVGAAVILAGADDGEARRSACEIEKRTVSTAAFAIRSDTGRLPQTDDELMASGFLESRPRGWTIRVANGVVKLHPIGRCA